MSTTQPITSTRRKQDKVSSVEGQKRKQLAFVWEFPMLIKQFTSMNWKIIPSMGDLQLTNIANLCDPKTVTKRIVSMQRLRAIDKLGDGKRKEFVTYQVELKANSQYDTGVRAAFQTVGLDKQCEVRGVYTDDSDEMEYKKGREYNVYTIPWLGETTFDEIVESDYEIELDACSFTYHGTKDWGGFSPDEFRELDYLELEERGRNGHSGYPTDFLFSRQPTADRIKFKEEKKTNG